MIAPTAVEPLDPTGERCEIALGHDLDLRPPEPFAPLYGPL
jgi:hypothetical protein